MTDSHTHEGIAAQFAAAKAAQANETAARRVTDEKVKRRNLQQRRAFRLSHGLLVVLLLCLFCINAVGIFLFTKGFLLTRMVLEHKSTCKNTPLSKYGDYPPSSATAGCWHPKTFDKAVIVVIDALRWDFTIPFVPDNTTAASHFHNAFTAPYRIASEHPENAVLLPFIADPPTTTLQRLKGLTTGSLPTFIDAGSNFAGTAIEEDNLIAQLRTLGKRIAFLGDDTWTSLFPGYFEEELTHPYESLNVWDLHTVDNGVNEHIFPLLHPSNSSSWDVLIGHYLGVDHAGHRYGPDHFAMTEKLRQMDKVVQRLADSIDDKTLLVVMGDHGMDPKGDHGGESQGEIEAALWMYAKKPVFGRLPESFTSEKNEVRSVAQIDLVPTLSLLLGLPIPFNNLGAPIAEAFLKKGGSEGWKNLVQVARLTAAQIKRYQQEYSGKKDEDLSASAMEPAWQQGEQGWAKARRALRTVPVNSWMDSYDGFSRFQALNLETCKDLWARFDVVSMAAGIAVLVGSVAILLVFARGAIGDGLDLTDTLLVRLRNGLAIGTVSALGVVLAAGDNAGMPKLHVILLGTAGGMISGFAEGLFYVRRRIASIVPTSSWGVLSIIFTVLNSAMFGSNSFTINEDKTLTFFIATFGIAGVVGSQRNSDLSQRMLGTYHSIVLLFLTRLASLSRLCREEQMPYCTSTFYASATSSVSAPWSLALLFFMSLALPSIIKSFYSGTRSYEGPAPVYLWVFRFGLILSAIFWTLDSADNGSWWPESTNLVKVLKLNIAQVVLAIGFIAGNIGYAWSSLCLNVDVQAQSEAAKNGQPPRRSVYLLGYANTHGSRYFLLVLSWALGLILLQKPMGGLSMGILLWQLLTVLEIVDTNDLSREAIGPVVLALLGNSHFFSTGHQATLSSIQWESAFIPLTSIRYPWSPLLVVGNTLGPQILTAIAVPLIALWKAPPKKVPGSPDDDALLWKVAKAAMTFILYHATIATSSVICAGWLRRHLMLYRIFSPRFMLGAVTLLVAEVVAVLVGVGGVRWNTEVVGSVFGY